MIAKIRASVTKLPAWKRLEKKETGRQMNVLLKARVPSELGDSDALVSLLPMFWWKKVIRDRLDSPSGRKRKA